VVFRNRFPDWISYRRIVSNCNALFVTLPYGKQWILHSCYGISGTRMPTFDQVLGVLIFLVVWLLLLKTRWRWLPLGRAMACLLGSAAYVACGILSADEAYKAINLPTIALLTGCMLISAYMEKEGMFALLGSVLASRGSPFACLLRVSVVSGLSSALLTNDTTCVILTPVVGRVCRSRKLNPAPYLLALATSANIGSACSPIGNPQNMIIALSSGLSFLQFLTFIGVSSLVGLLANTAFLSWMYRADIFRGRAYQWTEAQTTAVQADNAAPAAAADAQHASHVAAPLAAVSHATPILEHVAVVDGAAIHSAPIPEVVPASQFITGRSLTKRQQLTRIVLIAIPFALLFADKWIGLGWVTLLGGIVLAIIDGQAPEPILARVDGNLLFFFANLFIVVAGFNVTKVPEYAWDSIQGSVDMNTGSGLLLYTTLILIGSNTVSNVPLVLLLTPKLSLLPPSDAALSWALLAYISTIAGNLTLLGSVANLIVAERAKAWYNLSFMEYLVVGAPSTLVLCAVGVPVVRQCVLSAS
jgi:Na+/H+ antiporter NhaD/arsenite permease-like protein